MVVLHGQSATLIDDLPMNGPNRLALVMEQLEDDLRPVEEAPHCTFYI